MIIRRGNDNLSHIVLQGFDDDALTHLLFAQRRKSNRRNTKAWRSRGAHGWASARWRCLFARCIIQRIVDDCFWNGVRKNYRIEYKTKWHIKKERMSKPPAVSKISDGARINFVARLVFREGLNCYATAQ